MRNRIIFLFLFSILTGICSAQNSIITTVVGNGSSGTSGDGGPATAAGVYCPAGVAFDGSGNLYIQESCSPSGPNQGVRKINTAGIISSILTDTGTVRATYSGIPAANAWVWEPGGGIGVNSFGQVFIPDYSNMQVDKIDTSRMVSIYAGTGSGMFGGPATAAFIDQPWDVTTDKAGNVYITSQMMGEILKVDSTGTITSVAGLGGPAFSGDGGPATAAGVDPYYIATDAFGNIYISEVYRIRKIDAYGIINTIAGTGVGGFAGERAAPPQPRVSMQAICAPITRGMSIFPIQPTVFVK